MSLTAFLEKIKRHEPVSFDETIAVITENYDYQPTAFSNGLGAHQVINEAGQNEGSCKIFAFAQLNQLDQQQTLHLFGDYYRREVLNDPNGSGHQNIRNFMDTGWAGIRFHGVALTVKS
jgi:hypothetical protein